jgi:predicted regulator of Ras-like GTPase activity (Roadblock/LC7/MglB family)
MSQQNRVSRWQILRQILDDLCQAEGIKAAFLASDEALHIASVAPRLNLDEEELVGFVVRTRQMAALLQKQMRWSKLDEVSVESAFRDRLVIRSVQIGDQALILTVLVAPRHPYRRSTTRALRAIRRVWDGQR